MKNIALLILIGVSTTLFAQDKKEKEPKTIASIVKDLSTDEGLIPVYFNEESKLYFEIKPEILGKDILMVTRLAALPSGYSPYTNAGSKTSEMVIHFIKKGNTIQVRQISFTNEAEEEDPIQISVTENNLSPILAAFDIENEEGDTYLIDVSGYFNDDSPGFNVVNQRLKDQYKMANPDKKRSSIDKVSSFPQNTEVLHTLSYPVRNAPRGNSASTFTFQVNHSMILLPEDKMPIRYADERVGWFSLQKYNYSSEALKADDFRVVRRWRLEPKDPQAYMRGELVEPVKPIVYYLDPATPLKWRPYFKKGIEDWNIAFEKAGFKNAIIAKDPPSKEENPDFNPEDVRFSTVRYVASTTRNATGPSVSDPRTGEIIESDIIWYHNHLRSYRNRYLLETGAANPKARSLNTPEEEIGEMMRRVIAHEVGHALGLPHNMKASSAYPVDSLRSGTFTQKMGIAATIMDYARYNYIAQPGDDNIRFVRQMGPYDDYAIEWGYRYFGQAPEQERITLKSFVDERSLNPIYMFGSGGGDPNSQTENIGDDPVKATAYGISNLKIVGQNLENWTINDGDTYDDLDELYGEFLGVYRRYMFHVLNLVGGVYETRRNKGQEGITYQAVSSSKQMEALNFIQKNMWDTQDWLMTPGMVANFEREGALLRISGLQSGALNSLMNSSRLNRLLSSYESLPGGGLSPTVMFNTVYKGLITNQSNPDVLERNLQKNFIIRMQRLIEDEGLNPELKGLIYDLLNMTEVYMKKAAKSAKGELKAHYTYCLYLIDLNDEK